MRSPVAMPDAGFACRGPVGGIRAQTGAAACAACQTGQASCATAAKTNPTPIAAFRQVQET